MNDLNELEAEAWWRSTSDRVSDLLFELRTAQQANRELQSALRELFIAYCSQMHEEYDFPGRPWSPERDNDTVAIRARELLGSS